METLSKQYEISIMTYEEEEEINMIYQNYETKCNKIHSHKK